MSFTEEGFNLAKSTMAFAINKALDDAEQLRKAVVEVSSNGAAAAPAGFLEIPGDGEVSLADTSVAAVGGFRNPIDKPSVT